MTSQTSVLHTRPLPVPSLGKVRESADPRPAFWPHRLPPQAPWRLNQSDGLVLLHGHQAVLRLGLQAAVELSLAGEAPCYLDGVNAFDSVAIDRLAGDAGSSSCGIPSSIRLSRAVTCHQMVHLVRERLRQARGAPRGGAIILSGPLEPFYDEAVSAAEAVRLAQVLFASLRLLTGQGCRVLCLCPPPALPRRGHLLEALRRKADRAVEAVEGPEGLVLRERRAGLLSSWSLPHEAWTGL